MALSTIAALITDPVAMFETAIACEVFGLDRTDDGVPPFTFMMCGETAGVPVPTTSGGALTPTHQWQDALDADLVVMPAGAVRDSYPEELLDVIRGAHARGATILSICTGAFVLGETGLLDGLTAVTHWRYAESSPGGSRRPRCRWTSSTSTTARSSPAPARPRASTRCCTSCAASSGSTVATRIARRMVVPPQRDGGQRQYVEAPVPEIDCESMQPVLSHITDNLDAPHTVPDLARLAMMSERTFARRFVAETGTTPHKWIVQQRVLRARELLESTDLPVESVAIAQRVRVGGVAAHPLPDRRGHVAAALPPRVLRR